MKISTYLVLGYFGYHTNQLDGQTVKTRDIFRLVKGQFKNAKVEYFDTQDFRHNKCSIFKMIGMLCRCDRLIYLPANNNLKYIFPFVYIFSKIFRFSIDYYVVGGWLSTFLKGLPIHRRMLRNIRGIHVETQRLLKDFKNQYGYTNVDIFPNFRFYDFNPIPSKSDKLRVVFMARIMKEKGLDWMFELAQRVSEHSLRDEVEFTFYGQINESDRDYFLSEVDKYPNVSYKGALQPNDIHQTLSNYDVLVLPTHFYTEGLPGSIVDAYISGIPVIVTEWLNSREFVEDGKSGFIIPFEHGQNQLFNRIELLNSDRKLLRQMQANTLIKRKEFAPPIIDL